MKPKFTFKQFQAQYPNDDACLDAIMQRRYGHVEACPKCGVTGKLTRIQKRRAYACKEGCHIYPCAGTVFEHSSTTLTLWFHAMYLFTATRNGVSAKELERQLGVTYKCAWRIGHQLRELMAARDAANNPGPLEGHVEVDEAYIGGKQKGNKRKLHNKVAVVGAIQRAGALKATVVRDGTTLSVLPVVLKDVAPGATVSTDKSSIYRSLTKRGYTHGVVNHDADQWKNGIYCTNRIEGFWSHLKRGIVSTHVAVSRKHMQKYVNEFAYRYNNRDAPADMFKRMLSQISKPISS